jgi:hypothetical protein
LVVVSRRAALSSLSAVLLLVCGCSSDDQEAASTMSIGAPSTSVADTIATVRADPAIVATVDGEVLSIDFTGNPLDRAMHYTVTSDTDTDGVGQLVGYLATEGGPGTFIPHPSDQPLNFPDGLVTGPGPDVFDIAGLAAGEYTACAVTMTESEPGLVCVDFTIE